MTPALAVVVIDPQRAFVDPRGTFAQVYGMAETAPLRAGIRRLVAYLMSLPTGVPMIVVRSVYPPLSRCSDAASPLAFLCASGTGIDCDLAIPASYCQVTVTKHDLDAWEEQSFRERCYGLPEKVTSILVCGFTATSCVRLTARALAMNWGIQPDRSVVVTPLLAFARRSAYLGPPRRQSRFQQAMSDMSRAGVRLIYDYRDAIA